MAQQALDIVSLDDQCSQFEVATVVLQPLLGVAVGANLDVNLERAAHQLSIRTIWSFDHSSASAATMRGRLFAMRMRRCLAASSIVGARGGGCVQREAHFSHRQGGGDVDTRLTS